MAREFNTTTESITVAATATGADSTVLYTCPANHEADIGLLLLSNNNAAAKKVYLQYYHADNTTYYYVLKAHSIAANSSYSVIDSSTLHIHAGDKITLYGETTNTIQATASIKEYFNPNRP